MQTADGSHFLAGAFLRPALSCPPRNTIRLLLNGHRTFGAQIYLLASQLCVRTTRWYRTGTGIPDFGISPVCVCAMVNFDTCEP